MLNKTSNIPDTKLNVPGKLLFIFLCLSSFSSYAIDSIEEAMSEARDYEFGQPSTPLEYITELVLDVQRNVLAEKLANELAGDGSFAYKQFICRQLLLIGGRGQVDDLAPLLLDEKLSDMARYALEAIPGEESTQALRDALLKSTGLIQAGIINSLSKRNDDISADEIAQFIDSPDANVQEAAIKASGLSIEVLEEKAKSSKGSLKLRIMDVLLARAYSSLTHDERDISYPSIEIGDLLFEADNDIAIRAAALQFKLSIANGTDHGGDPFTILSEALMGDNKVLAGVALQNIHLLLDDDNATINTIALFEKISPERKPALLIAIADQTDEKVLANFNPRPLFHSSLASPDLAVRTAAIYAVGKLGNKDSVAPLLDIITNDPAPEAKAAAREALYTLAGDDINAALLSLAANATPETQLELVKAMGARRMHEAMTLLQDYAKTQSGELQEEAYKALGEIATREDIPKLLDMLKDATADAHKYIESALVSALRHAESAEDRLAPLLDYLKTDVQPEIESTLYDVLGKIGDTKGLEALREGSHAAMESVRDAAIEALVNWPDDATIDDLWTLAKEGNDKARDTAMSGYVRLLRMSEDMSDEDALARYKEVMQLAHSDEVKKAILAGLGELKSKEALAYVESFAQDEAIKREAKAAADQIRVKFYTATASHMDADASKAIDGNMDTRWTSGIPMKPGIWFMLDLGNEATVSAITLDGSRSGSDFPRGYELYLSNDKDNFNNAIEKGDNDRAILRVTFPPTKCRYIKIVQTGEATGNFWSIHEIRVDTE